LGPLGTAATNRRIVPASGNYDDEVGGMIGRGNRSTQCYAAMVFDPHAGHRWQSPFGIDYYSAFLTLASNGMGAEIRVVLPPPALAGILEGLRRI
jgi:hypothetical protein